MLAMVGGYTSGLGEGGFIAGANGTGAEDAINGATYDGIGVGGGYYTYGRASCQMSGVYESWFGEGGCWYGTRFSDNGSWSTAGSGGVAGEGGIIKYSSISEIKSYNGNRITEDNYNYDEICYEYDKDGNLLGENSEGKTRANVVTFENDKSKKIIPAKIFIQDGIRRAVYDNLCYMSEERKIQYGVNGNILDAKIKNMSINGFTKNVRIMDEDLDILCFSQGIGSRCGLHRAFKRNIYSRFIIELKQFLSINSII